ncbi:MAG: thioesterase family protein [Ignavibacteriota bacterium]
MSDLAEPFELPIRVEPADIDELGHVNNVTYLRWVQDVAVAHWMTLAPDAEKTRLLWIVLRHEIDYLKAAQRDDAIVARTWVGAATRLRFDRHTEIVRAADRSLLARARTVWCPIEAATRRPAHVSAELRARFSVPPILRAPADDRS